MDPLTHSATGIFLARTGMGRSCPHHRWILLLAALVPDIDIVTLAGGSLSYLKYHRHLSHALVAAPVMALLPVVAVRLAARRPLPWAHSFGISLAGVLSHLALDWTNIYGVRFLLPFSADWFHLDITSVVDLWIWAALLIGLLGPVLVRLVNAEIGASSRGLPGRGFAWFTLGFLLLYNGGRALLHERAVAVLEARLYQGSAPLRVAALPDVLRPLRWRGLVETAETYSFHQIDLAGEFDPTRGAVWYKPEPTAALEAARRSEVFRLFAQFAEYPFWRVLPAGEVENGLRVEAMDLRFGTPERPGFVATAILNSRLEVLRAWFQFGAARPR